MTPVEPGKKAMGPKTAAKLLQKFDSLAELWSRIDEVESVKLKESLLGHHDLIERNRLVVRLNGALACSPGWTALERRVEEAGRLRSFYERMEFHSLLKDMDQPSLL